MARVLLYSRCSRVNRKSESVLDLGKGVGFDADSFKFLGNTEVVM